VNGLSLFSGIGGLDLALSEWVRPIAYCEAEPYAQAVLMSRMWDGRLVRAPIWPDVRTLRGCDLLYGGFPCQDISAAGAGAGLAGERSGLYFELERIVRETKPAFVFLENVPAIRTRGLGRVVWGLSELGYDCRWTVVSAAEVGAWHLRKRWFLLAHASTGGRCMDWIAHTK
jgi:DNA (cytosine-5)-methyltransferase 1